MASSSKLIPNITTKTERKIAGRRLVNVDEPGSVYFAGVTKSFRKHTVAKQSYTTVKSSLVGRIFRRKAPGNYLTALDDMNVVVEPGSSLGIVGRNGSGKSTFLKLIAGIYRPDIGEIRVSGRVSALIELGAGFHPDFTGRENIHLGGVMYGLSRKEIAAREEDIIRYAELEDFIDDPVRTYSSGMYMRLGFSLAVHTDPDILLIDEVLAVGDAPFIHRCHETISEFKRRGKTLIFVTHDLGSVERWCDEAIWLNGGKVERRGEPRWVIDSYLSEVEKKEKEDLRIANEEAFDIARTPQKPPEIEVTTAGEPVADGLNEDAPEKHTRWGSGDVEITKVVIKNSRGEETWLVHGDEMVDIEVDYRIHVAVEDLVFGIGILRADGICVHGTNTDIETLSVPLPNVSVAPGVHLPQALSGSFRYRVKKFSLLEATYYLDVAAHKSDGTPYDYHHERYKFSVRNPFHCHGVYAPDHEWSFEPGYAFTEAKTRKEA